MYFFRQISQNDCTSLLFRFRLFLTRSALYSLCPELLLYFSLSRLRCTSFDCTGSLLERQTSAALLCWERLDHD